jgi:hypothetical protein
MTGRIGGKDARRSAQTVAGCAQPGAEIADGFAVVGVRRRVAQRQSVGPFGHLAHTLL